MPPMVWPTVTTTTDFVTRHTRALGSQQITGRILVSCGKRAICSNLGTTIIT